MSSEPDAVYNIYARQLFIRRHGYPLWKPEPESAENEIRVGDVGFLEDGAFFKIFNATDPEDHPSQANGVPEGFEQWTVKDLHKTTMKKAIESALCSRSVSSFSMNGEVTRYDFDVVYAIHVSACNRCHQIATLMPLVAGSSSNAPRNKAPFYFLTSPQIGHSCTPASGLGSICSTTSTDGTPSSWART